MQKDRVITALLLLVLSVLIATSIIKPHSLAQQSPSGLKAQSKSLRKEISNVKTRQDWDILLSKLPTADYNAPEPADPEARDKRRGKNKHYDKAGMVVKNPDTSITLTEALYEGKELWPLPTGQSDAIVVGEIQDRQSYLSNDKSGVYTEFTINLAELLKGDAARLSRGATITATRLGGVVQYPGGHKRLYLVSGEGLPLEAGQYVLFLKGSGQDQDYTVLTMYRLEQDEVIPVDEGAQFEPYRGQKKVDFLSTIRNKVADP